MEMGYDPWPGLGFAEGLGTQGNDTPTRDEEDEAWSEGCLACTRARASALWAPTQEIPKLPSAVLLGGDGPHDNTTSPVQSAREGSAGRGDDEGGMRAGAERRGGDDADNATGTRIWSPGTIASSFLSHV